MLSLDDNCGKCTASLCACPRTGDHVLGMIVLAMIVGLLVVTVVMAAVN